MGIKHALRVAVVISGRGSNFMALHAHAAAHAYEIAGVVSNNPNAPGLLYARAQGLPVAVVNHRDYQTTALFDAALAAALDRYEADVIALAGFLRVLGPAFVRHYAGRLINIHPSLLPAFPGLDTHARALKSGAREHGATVHFVTDALDGGPIIAQARLDIMPGEDPEHLAKRVLALEHELYPAVLGRFASGQIPLPGTPITT
ncbi:MAG TPA: phosphoribosylglycinamide formyltransferase [Acidiferrobacter sp.]|nr:phosphoribosylglycinamide formyltransferase [Acidiferrobacter sp.]